jgi:hypothetical protein
MVLSYIKKEEHMTPKSHDIDTAKDIVGDARMRVIEAKARQDADNGVRDGMAHVKTEVGYWDRVVQSMELVVYDATYRKRLERIQRIKEKENT